MDYSILPPLHATLNGITAVLLIVGFFLIRSGKKKAHEKVMLGALASSAVFLASYLWYHCGVGPGTFSGEYPTARIVYFSLLIPHIILAVVNVPLSVLLVVAALRGTFEKHRKLAGFTFPSWLFVSITGIIIYFMVHAWFPPAAGAGEGEEASAAVFAKDAKISIVEAQTKAGDLVFEPAFQVYKAEPGQKIVEVTFQVTNVGDQPSTVGELVSTCACLSVEMDRNPIPPKGKATITGVFDTEKLKGQSERKITVVLEGRHRPVFLTTRIETDPLYVLKEPMTTWKVGGEPEPRTVEFRVKSKDPIHVLSVESKREEVTAEVITIEEGRAYDIVLTPDSTESSLLGIVRITTDCQIESHARPLAYFSIQ